MTIVVRSDDEWTVVFVLCAVKFCSVMFNKVIHTEFICFQREEANKEERRSRRRRR